MNILSTVFGVVTGNWKGYAAAALLALVAVGGLYVKSTLDERDQLIADLATERSLHEGTKQALEVMVSTIERQEKANRELRADYQTARRERDETLRILQDHDLTKLAAAKPGLMSRRFTAGTKRLFAGMVDDSETFYSGGDSPQVAADKAGAAAP